MVSDAWERSMFSNLGRFSIIIALTSFEIFFPQNTVLLQRNARIFRGVSLTQEAFFTVVDRCMRDRLLSLASLTPARVTAVSPSLLELYFWFVSPYISNTGIGQVHKVSNEIVQ
ncbi:hypothetical protein YC2023_073997 [Brassica napus]